MNTSSKPLAKALHTVTVVAHVSRLAPKDITQSGDRTVWALGALGYAPEQMAASPDLFAACVAAVIKAVQA